MKKTGLLVILTLFVHFMVFGQKEAAYFEVGTLNSDIHKSMSMVKDKLTASGLK
jgi:hypothetical protein